MSSALHLHLLALEEQHEEAGAPFVEYSFVEPASNELEQHEEAGGPFVESASNELEAASEADESPGIAESRNQPASEPPGVKDDEEQDREYCMVEEIEEEPHCNAVLVAKEVPSELWPVAGSVSGPIAVPGAVAGPVEFCPSSMDLLGTSVQGHLCMHHVSTNIKTPASSPRAPPHKEGLIGD